MRYISNPSYKHNPKLIQEFNKHRDSISFKDHTQYTEDLLKLAIGIVLESKKIGLSNKHILWLTKQIYENKLTEKQIDEDFLPLVKFHYYNQELLAPIESYKNVSMLSRDIEGLDKEKETVSDQELDIFFEKNGWFVAMPHTTKASCLLGKGTTWCTARTKSQNLFLNYVGKFEENIVLFYVIKLDGNPTKNPDDKLSVGFKDGEPFLEDEYGGISVNANNSGLNIKRFGEILGEELAKEMLIKMDEKSQNIKGKHPAKKEMERIARSVDRYLKKIDEFKNENELDDFKRQLFKFNLSQEMQEYIFNNEDRRYLKILANNPSITEPLQIMFSNSAYFREILSENGSLTEFVQLKLIKGNIDEEGDLDTMMTLANNVCLTEKAQLMMTKAKDWRIIESLAENRNLFKSVQNKLSSINYTGVLEELSRNPVIDKDIQIKLYRKGKTKTELAQNKNLTEEVQIKLAKDKSEEVKRTLAENINITEATQLLLIENENDKTYTSILSNLADNPNLYESAQIKLANYENFLVKIALARKKLSRNAQAVFADDKDDKIREKFARNSYLTEEIQLKLADDRSREVREALAERSGTAFESVQLKLSKDKDIGVKMSLARNENLYEKTQQKLVDEKNIGIGLILAKNNRISNSVREKLAVDKNNKVRAMLAANITISEPIQIILASDKDKDVRKALSRNRFLTERAKNFLERENIDNLAKEIEKW